MPIRKVHGGGWQLLWHAPGQGRMLILCVVALVAAEVALGLVHAGGGANIAGVHYKLDSDWSVSPSGILAHALIAAGFFFVLRHVFQRQRELEASVAEHNTELRLERRRELRQNRLLEMLVTGQPLGSILDESLRFATSEMPGTGWVILLRTHDKIQIAAVRNVATEMRELLCTPGILPFESWHIPKYWASIESEKAWRAFREKIGPVFPRAAYARPIGGQDSRAGVVLVFPEMNSEPADSKPIVDSQAVLDSMIDGYARMIRLALEQHLLSEDLQFRAHHDGLTGLPNRLLVQSRLALAIDEAKVTRELVAIAVIDLDGLKPINDSFGQRVGDFLIQEMALRLRKVCRPSDTLARLSGDDFSILFRGLRDSGEARKLAESCLDVIRQPLAVQGQTIRATASIGVAVYPEEGQEAEVLQRHAEAAMYCAKSAGRDRVRMFCDTTDALDRVRMQDAIREGLANGYFHVYYQPKFHDDGYLAGCEALARFDHPRLGKIPPTAFIPAAEQGGLIVALGNWVLREVCRQITSWRAQGVGDIPVAVNVSSLQLDRSDFGATVENMLTEFQVSPWCLELELTESLLIACTEGTHKQLGWLRDMGVRISIDDFGTGYSSLSYLHRLPIDAIKLDRSFVQSIDTDDMSCRLVQAMIGVARRLGLDVVAEGVEREEQRDVLSASGCHLMQGFLFSKPLPPAELEGVLTTRRSAAADVRIVHRNDIRALAAVMGTGFDLPLGSVPTGVTLGL